MDSTAHCFYCHGTELQQAHSNLYHKRKADHGPFDFYYCRGCGSGLTLPPPRPDQLAQLYRYFEFGMSQLSRELMADNPDAAWHRMCAARLSALSGRSAGDAFSWIDAGAGGGEMALAMAEHFPNASGLAFDIHDCPPVLRGLRNVAWRQIDIAEDDFLTRLDSQADVVFATGVWEHVRRPDLFARNLLSLLKPGGVLYMTTPNYASIARRVFGTAWPYFIPGEHLCMPTPKGARLCLERELRSARGAEQRARISARPILVRYGVRFALAKLGMPQLAPMIPPRLVSYLPSGAMESVVRLAA